MNRQQSLENQRAMAPYKKAIARYVRSSMELKGLRYNDLSDALLKKGLTITPENLRSKVSKCLFSADLLAAIIEILGVQDVAMAEIIKLSAQLQEQAENEESGEAKD